MPRRQFSAPQPSANDSSELRVSKEKAIQELANALDMGEQLLRRKSMNPVEMDSHISDIMTWSNTVAAILTEVFCSADPRLAFKGVAASDYLRLPNSLEEGFDLKVSALRRRVDYLKSLIRTITSLDETGPGQSSTTSSVRGNASQATIQGTDVFIVHGRDNGAKETVARFVTALGLTPVVLHEQANMGRTILQKFMDHASKAIFSIVLLTPDDVGCLNPSEGNRLQPRARQNVILELGYFLSALGPHRVCALYSPGVELPSDFQGVLYIPFGDNDTWRFSVAKEMKAAGIPVDLNRLTPV